MLAGEGLHPSSKGARVKFSGTKRTVIDGPSQRRKSDRRLLAVAGEVEEEAIEWVKPCPNPLPRESEIEIRQGLRGEDFGPEFTPNWEQEDRLPRQKWSISKKS
jgi:hypothetical protein